MIQRISPPGAPTPRGPYSPAVRAGDCIYVSGQIAIDPGHRGGHAWATCKPRPARC